MSPHPGKTPTASERAYLQAVLEIGQIGLLAHGLEHCVCSLLAAAVKLIERERDRGFAIAFLHASAEALDPQHGDDRYDH